MIKFGAGSICIFTAKSFCNTTSKIKLSIKSASIIFLKLVLFTSFSFRLLAERQAIAESNINLPVKTLPPPLFPITS